MTPLGSADGMYGFGRPLHYSPWSIELWGKGGSIEKELALITDLGMARAAFREAQALFPDRILTLRQGIRVLAWHNEPAVDL